MTISTYRRIGNLSFALAIAGVLLFDSFRNRLIPGLVIIGAGVLAIAMNTFAQFRPLEPDDPECPADPPPAAQNNNNKEAASQPPEERRKADLLAEFLAQSGRLAARPDLWKLEDPQVAVDWANAPAANSVAEVIAQYQGNILATYMNTRGGLFYRYAVHHSQIYFSQRQAPMSPDWRAVHTALEIAGALNPQPTTYEVTLTPDGTIKISPRYRTAQDDPQFEEHADYPQKVGSQFVN